MKNLKKVLALVIALTMVLTTVAFASYPDVDADANYASAVELLSALEILQGDENGNFNPDNTITRAEYAAVVCRALGMENAANSAKGATIFTDVAADHWATGYINLASQQGIVNGKGNGIFDPEGNVTYAEAVKMLVVALGYEPMAASRGGYPTGYLTVANSTKITANVSSSGTDTAALRSTVAQLTANALEVANMDQTGFGTDTKYEVLDDYDNYTTLLTKMDIYKATGVVNSVDASEGTMELKLTEASDDYEFGYVGSKGDVDPAVAAGTKTISFDTNGVNVDAYLQQSVDVYVYKAGKSDYDVVYITASGIGTTLKIDAEDLKSGAATISKDREVVEYYETSEATKTTKIDVEANAPIYVNGYELPATGTGALINYTTGADLTTLLNGIDATIEFVENTDDKYYDRVLITVYQHGIVDDVEISKERINLLVDYVKFDSSDKNQVVNLQDKDGNAIKLEDVKEKDVLAMYVEPKTVTLDAGAIKVPEAKSFANNGNKITIIDLGANTVTGKIDGADDDNGEFYIDGTKYEYTTNGFADGNEDDIIDNYGAANASTKLDTEGTFYLDINGKVIGFDGTAGGNTKYGYILQAEYNNGNSFDKGWQVKMLTQDQGVVTFDLYKTFTYTDKSNTALTNGSVTYSNGGTGSEAELSLYKAANGSTPAGANYFKTDASKNVVEYKVTSDNELKSVEVKTDATAVGSATAKKEYKESTGKIDNKVLDDAVVVFNLDSDDIDDAYVTTLSALVDEGEYAGYVAAKGNSSNEWKVFVISAGDTKFNPEAGVNVVESVRKSTLGNQDSYVVSYYGPGDTDVKTLTFTDDSDTQAGMKIYTSLAKGDIFVANANSEGVVDDYVILAQVANKSAGFVIPGAFKAAYGSDFDGNTDMSDGVDYVFGYIDTISKKGGKQVVDVIANGTTTTLVVGNGVNEYSYKYGKNNYVEAGDWNGDYVDKATKDNSGNVTECTFIFAKLYDGDVVDIYSFNKRENSATAFTTKNSANPTASTASTKTEVKEEVKEETPVVEVPVAEEDFE